MAQQTINIGASPNDGTGTPLRTAFQYTNSNFSELYTAVGPSGNNIVVPGNATITGDLTVRTTGLILNTSGLGVGISPTSFGAGYGTIQVSGATGSGIKMGSPTNGSFIYSDNTWLNILTETNVPHRHFVNNQVQYTVQHPGVFTWFDGAGGTRMTLNATGLGVGGSPLVKLSVVDTVNTFAATFRGNLGTDIVAIGTTALGASINAYTAGFGAATNLVLQPNGGNVGIGVTPSAWASIYKTVEFANGSSIWGQTDIPQLSLQTNAFLNSSFAWIYKTTAAASNYRQTAGEHLWFTAPSGTAGNAITFTERLRLKETGQLRFVPLASDPAGAEAGDVYYNSTSNKLKCYNGTTWNDLF